MNHILSRYSKGLNSDHPEHPSDKLLTEVCNPRLDPDYTHGLHFLASTF